MHGQACVCDEVKQRAKLMFLSWTSFLEALCRIIDLTSVPTDDDLKTLRAETIMDYEEKLSQADADTQARLRVSRPSAEFGAPKTRPLAEKADRMISLMMGRLAILNKGALQMGSKRVSLMRYSTSGKLPGT